MNFGYNKCEYSLSQNNYYIYIFFGFQTCIKGGDKTMFVPSKPQLGFFWASSPIVAKSRYGKGTGRFWGMLVKLRWCQCTNPQKVLHFNSQFYLNNASKLVKYKLGDFPFCEDLSSLLTVFFKLHDFACHYRHY